MATTQIVQRQLVDGIINDVKVAAGAAIATTKLANGPDFIQRNGSVAFTSDQSHGGQKITNLGNGVAGTDAINLNQLNAAISNLNTMFDSKGSVRAATVANGTLATAFANGQTIDGVTLVTGDRILLKSQTLAQDNGIYTVNASGAPTRSTDFDAWAEIPGAFVSVEEGSVNADTFWLSTANQGGTLNTTPIPWVQIVTGGLVSGNFVDKETPAGSINGSNVTFTMANTPVSGSEHVYLNGLLQEVGGGNDYTISGGTITMSVAPLTGERIKVSYRK